MDFAYTAEQEKLREEVRGFIKANVTPELLHEADAEASTTPEYTLPGYSGTVMSFIECRQNEKLFNTSGMPAAIA